MFVVGYSWGKWKVIKQWSSKKFKNKINISLNSIIPTENEFKYKLQIRTLLEKNLCDVIQNEKMENIIKTTASKCEPGKPLLIFEEDDAWYILNTILNQIASQFSESLIKKDMGLNLTTQWYTFCLTYEKEDNLNMRKIRVMLIKREVLQNFPDENCEFILENFNHEIRVKTLQNLKQELRIHPYCFMDIEIAQ